MANFDRLMDIFDAHMMSPLIQRPPFISNQVRSARYLFLDLIPPTEAELTVVCAGREECTPDYRIERKAFRYHAVEYVMSGCGEVIAGGRKGVLGPGSIFAYGPEVEYTMAATHASGLIKCFLSFTGRAAPALLKRSGLGQGQTLQVHHTRWIHDLFDQILDCANLSRAAARVLSARLAEVLLLRIREDSRVGLQPRSDAHRTYARCRKLIEDQYLTVMSVSEVAAQCNLDPAYLSRLFKRFADENPLQYLTRLKMDHAAELIMRNGYNVKQAGAAVGFDDPYHFSRVFKRVHGLAPGRFRR